MRFVIPGFFQVLLPVACFTLCVTQANTQAWSKISSAEASRLQSEIPNIKGVYSLWNFDEESLRGVRNDVVQWIDIPLPDGSMATFQLKETPVFSEGLARKYPGYTSYTGFSEGGQLMVKMSQSPFGVHAMILGAKEGLIYIDPLSDGQRAAYISFFRKDRVKDKAAFFCGVSTDEATLPGHVLHGLSQQALRTSGDCQLRTYRLALACTGEYAKYHGGTIPKVLAAYNASMTRVNGVYERDVAVTMKLVENTDKLIFLDAASDPYTNNDGGVMLDQNQQTIDNLIGQDNYDIGHVFSTGGGGIAQLRAPCGGGKARGVTGLSAPVGDPFDIDYVCHEMGHQFGANHTQNNNCQRNGSTAVEPGSASTIMGYAGICDPNVQNNSDAHFHAVSISEIRNFIIAGNGNSCAQRTEIANTPPIVLDRDTVYTIPVSTAFALTAKAMDAEGDALTYCWEQTDSDVATMPPTATSKVGPAFRSVSPDLQPTRYFPDLARKYGQWEVLPSTSRSMDFTCTIRDNNLEGGCTSQLNHRVEFSTASGPFLLTYPNLSTVNWPVGSTQTVKWNVAKTDLAPVSCKSVDIFLSVDGGASYPYLLAENVPNTGAYDVVTPGLPTTKARVMVRASKNIFFDVSNASFRITSSFNFQLDNTQFTICDQDTLRIPFSINGDSLLAQPLEVSLLDLPQGIEAAISQSILNRLPYEGNIVLVTDQNFPLGLNTLVLQGVSGVQKIQLPINIRRDVATPAETNLISPEAGKSDVNGSRTLFVWRQVAGVSAYRLQVATNAEFTPVSYEAVVADTSAITTLEGGRVYFWRVSAVSGCTQHPVSAARAFRTKGLSSGKAILWSNNPLLVDAGSTSDFTTTQLNIASQNPEFVLCTVDTLPVHGQILRNGDPLIQGSFFTLGDIFAQKLQYQHSGDGASTDQMVVSVLDDQGRSLSGVRCKIRIRQGVLGVETIVKNPLRCHADADGVLEAISFGGVPPYQYSFNGGPFSTGNVLNDAEAGTYNCAVLDAAGDTAYAEAIVLSSPAPIVASAELSFYDIFVTASGGSGMLTYSLDGNTFYEENVFKDPGNGTYQVYVKDEAACLAIDSIGVNYSPLQVTAALLNDINCAGQKASIQCQASGGIPPYKYSVDGTTYQGNTDFSVDAGTITASVRDAGGKVVAAPSITTNTPSPIQIVLLQNRFQVIVLASGGTGKLQYSSNNNTFSDRDTFNFTQNGLYKIYVRDEKGCTRSADVNLNVLTTVLVNLTAVKCFGQQDGAISLQPTDGKPPFRYRLGNGPAGSNRIFQGLKAETYAYTVWDANQDSITGEAEILEPDSLSIMAQIDGDSLTLSAAGGVPPYLFAIDGGVAFLEVTLFNDLPSGEYKPAVRDANGCIASLPSIEILSSTEEEGFASWKLFPNPVTEQIYFSVGLLDKSIPILRNSIGSRVGNIRWQESGRLWSADLSHLPAGIYFISTAAHPDQYRRFIKM